MRRPAILAFLFAAFSVRFGVAAADQSAAARGTGQAEDGNRIEARPPIHQALEQGVQIQDRDLNRRMGAATRVPDSGGR
ncbi:MAG: hypothetical protein ACLQKA_00305 [Bryobacteraceae bacterium]